MNPRVWLSLFLTAQLVSCAAASPPLEGEAAQHALAKFAAGEAELPCRVACAGRWGWVSREAKMLYQTEQWSKLADLVTQVGYDDQLSWYYLGRSAESLGHYNAAKIYYLQSKFAVYPCKMLLDNCDGLVFPQAADAGLRSIATSIDQTGNGGSPASAPPTEPSRQVAEEQHDTPMREDGSHSQSTSTLVNEPERRRVADEDHGPYPENYKELIRNHFSTSLFDPYSAIYEFIDPVKLHHEIDGQIRSLWAACGTMNAKNRYGGYVGAKFFCTYIRDGKVLYDLIT